jgi:hypothetical protein
MTICNHCHLVFKEVTVGIGLMFSILLNYLVVVILPTTTKKGGHGRDRIQPGDVVIAVPQPDHRKSKFGLRLAINLN